MVHCTNIGKTVGNTVIMSYDGRSILLRALAIILYNGILASL